MPLTPPTPDELAMNGARSFATFAYARFAKYITVGEEEALQVMEEDLPKWREAQKDRAASDHILGRELAREVIRRYLRPEAFDDPDAAANFR